jgi:hypothetical protein
LEPLTEALKLPKGSIALTVKLFGKTAADTMLSVVDQIMAVLGADTRLKNTAKGLAGLLAGYLEKFDIEPESKSKSAIRRSSAPKIIGDALHIPPFFFEGMLHSLRNEVEETQNIIVNLCNLQMGKFVLDESYCRGFISMA